MSIHVHLVGGERNENLFTVTSPHPFPQALVFIGADGEQEIYTIFQVKSERSSEIASVYYRVQPKDDTETEKEE